MPFAPSPIAFRRAGPGGTPSPALVLLHGVGLDSSVWGPQIEAFRATHDVIAPDMLGHGGSDLPPEAPALADYSGAVLGLLDALGIECAAVIGHSMGAMIALDLALRHPARVSHVVAMNAVFRRSPAQRAAVQARAADLAGIGDAASSAATIARWFGDPIPPRLADAAAQLRQLLAAVDREGYARTYRLFAAVDDAHAEALPRLAMPALFLTGELDPNSTPAMSHAMAALAPRGRAEVLPGERHMMTMVSPETVNDSLRRFLA